MMQSSLRIFSGILALSLSSSLYALPDFPSDISVTWHNCFGTFAVDGSKYVGEWKEGKWDGQGTYTFADGRKYVGEFKENKYHGQGTYTYADGRVARGYYMNGEYVPSICQDMGLTKGTEAFGQCVLKLIEEITKDD